MEYKFYQTNQIERAEEYQRIKELKIQMRKKNEHLTITDGFFKPKINRTRHDLIGVKSKSVHENLYAYKDIYKLNQDLKQESINENFKNMQKNQTKSSFKKTENLLETSIYEKLTKLFKEINTTSDEEISLHELDNFIKNTVIFDTSFPRFILQA